VRKCLSSLKLACHAPNPHTGFKAFRMCGFILWQEFLACFQDCLVYFVVVSLASLPPWKARVGTVGCFLVFFVTALFLCVFQLSFHLFCDSDALPLFVSSE
jgi:hypothetical protein